MWSNSAQIAEAFTWPNSSGQASWLLSLVTWQLLQFAYIASNLKDTVQGFATCSFFNCGLGQLFLLLLLPNKEQSAVSGFLLQFSSDSAKPCPSEQVRCKPVCPVRGRNQGVTIHRWGKLHRNLSSNWKPPPSLDCNTYIHSTVKGVGWGRERQVLTQQSLESLEDCLVLC
jgi:hypothetical protein